jgi:hypothetical protein
VDVRAVGAQDLQLDPAADPLAPEHLGREQDRGQRGLRVLPEHVGIPDPGSAPGLGFPPDPGASVLIQQVGFRQHDQVGQRVVNRQRRFGPDLPDVRARCQRAHRQVPGKLVRAEPGLFRVQLPLLLPLLQVHAKIMLGARLWRVPAVQLLDPGVYRLAAAGRLVVLPGPGQVQAAQVILGRAYHVVAAVGDRPGAQRLPGTEDAE